MPKKGRFTTEEAAKSGLIECPPIGRALSRWADERWATAPSEEGLRNQNDGPHPLVGLSLNTGVYFDLIYRMTTGEKQWVSFDIADKLICATYGSWLEAGLWELYDSFDFTYLDLHKPTSPDADGLLELLDSGLRPKVLAKIYGVPTDTLLRNARARRGQLAAA